MRIVLTGGIACGKSQFAKFLQELGVLTLDADDIVHEIIPLAERRRIAEKIFADPAARRSLEAKIHPQVKARLEAWFNEAAPSLKAAIIPLLFECNWQDDYDIILCISSPVGMQIRRMVETRGMTEVQAQARIKAQLPVSEKAARSDYVIVNDSTLAHLRDEAVKCVEWLTAKVEGKEYGRS